MIFTANRKGRTVVSIGPDEAGNGSISTFNGKGRRRSESARPRPGKERSLPTTAKGRDWSVSARPIKEMAQSLPITAKERSWSKSPRTGVGMARSPPTAARERNFFRSPRPKAERLALRHSTGPVRSGRCGLDRSFSRGCDPLSIILCLVFFWRSRKIPAGKLEANVPGDFSRSTLSSPFHQSKTSTSPRASALFPRPGQKRHVHNYAGFFGRQFALFDRGLDLSRRLEHPGGGGIFHVTSTTDRKGK